MVSSLPTAETRYDKKNFKKDDRVTLSMYKGNNNKQLCVAWEVKCSHHNEDAQKNFPRQKQTAGKTKHLTVLFFPTALVPSVTKKKKATSFLHSVQLQCVCGMKYLQCNGSESAQTKKKKKTTTLRGSSIPSSAHAPMKKRS